jgi:segregation and condensation protein B
MSLKAKIEAIIYAAEEPITVDQIAAALREAGLLNDLAVETTNSDDPKARAKAERNAARAALKPILEELHSDYANSERGMEVRQVANGYRISTKPEHHDVIRAFAKSLKPPVRLSLQALETLAVIAYKQPVTAPEISEIRGVDSSGVLATLIDRKLITTAGRKQVIGRPILYKTTKEFLLRFGLNEISELPSMEEFEKMTQGPGQEELFDRTPVADATGVPDAPEEDAPVESTGEEQPQDAEAHSNNP